MKPSSPKYWLDNGMEHTSNNDDDNNKNAADHQQRQRSCGVVLDHWLSVNGVKVQVSRSLLQVTCPLLRLHDGDETHIALDNLIDVTRDDLNAFSLVINTSVMSIH